MGVPSLSDFTDRWTEHAGCLQCQGCRRQHAVNVRLRPRNPRTIADSFGSTAGACLSYRLARNRSFERARRLADASASI
jgi:hypothetical protein